MPCSDVTQSEEYKSQAVYVVIVRSNDGQMLVLHLSSLLLSGFSLLGLLQTKGTLCQEGPVRLPC